jgi:hypothetical protein
MYVLANETNQLFVKNSHETTTGTVSNFLTTVITVYTNDLQQARKFNSPAEAFAFRDVSLISSKVFRITPLQQTVKDAKQDKGTIQRFTS